MKSLKKFQFLDVKRFFESPRVTNPNPVSNSRRTALKQMSVFMVGISPGINTIGKAIATPFSYELTNNGIVFSHGGTPAWEVLSFMFDGSPKVIINESSNELRVQLKDAYYPGTKICADFQAIVNLQSEGWLMEIAFPELEINQKVKFTEWLNGKSVVSGKTKNNWHYQLDPNDSLLVSGPSPLTIDHCWQMRIKSPDKITLQVFGKPEKYEELVLSLSHLASEMITGCGKATCFELYCPEGNFQALESLRFHGESVISNPKYPFTFTSLIFSEASGNQTRTLWASNETGKEANAQFLVQQNGINSLGLFRSRLYKEYNTENSPFIFTADLGDSPQWIGAAGASFALKGSSDHRFILTGNDNEADFLDCKALLASSRIQVFGGTSVPVDYNNAPEVSVVPQYPIKVKPRTMKQGEVLTPGKILEEAPDDDSRANWIYINQEPMKVKFKVDKPILFNVIRPEDFINLQFEFVNFSLEDNLLKIDNKKDPAFLIVHFPSQHTREEIMRDISSSGFTTILKRGSNDGTPPNLHTPVKFLRAKSSRLVYRVPADYNPIPVTLDNLLNWKDFDLQVNYRARWFNQISNISLIKTQLQVSSMVYSQKPLTTRMQLSTPNISYQARQVKAVDSEKAKVVPVEKPKSVQEVRVAMATTPKGPGAMALSDEQFNGLLASPLVDQINTANLQGSMKRLFAMKEPSKYETMIEAPTYLQISPNQFAAFQHFSDLRDAAGTYDPAEAGVVETNDESAIAAPVKPATKGRQTVQRITPSTLSKAQSSNINFFRNVVTGSTASPNYKGIVSSRLMKMPLAILLPKGNLFELWHTRLGVKLASGEIDEDVLNELKTIRVLWSEFANENYKKTNDVPAVDDYFYSLPTPRHAHQLVHLTSNYLDLVQENTRKKYTPHPVKAEKLMLSALGSWIDFKLNIPEDVELLSIKAWLQRATMGRDHYIKIVERGNLFPFGHKALLVIIAERKIRTINNVNSAVLVQREFIIVKQPELFYGKQQGSNDFIPFPFQRVELKDMETEIFTKGIPNEANFIAKELNVKDGSGKPQYFRIDVDDASGKTVRMEVPLSWIPATTPDAKDVIKYYNDSSWDYFTSSATAKPIAYARSLVPGDTTFETAGIIFKAREFPKNENGSTFYPEVLESSIYIRQLEELTGKRSPVRIHLLDDNNLSMVFAEFIDDDKPKLAFDNTEKGGGFLAPNMNLSGLSKLTGLVGNKLDDLEKVLLKVEDVFSMADKLMPKLFGAIRFMDLLLDVDLTPAMNAVKSAIENIRSQIEDLQQELLSILARVDNEVKKLNKLIEVIGKLLNETDIVGVLQDTQKLAQAFTSYGINIEGDAVTALNAAVVLGKEIQDKGVELNSVVGFINDAQGFKNKLKDAGISITSQIDQAVDQTLKVVKALDQKGFDDLEIIGIIGGLGLASQLVDIQGLVKTLAMQASAKVIEALPEIPNVKFQIKGNEIVVEYHWKPKTKNEYSAAGIFKIKNTNESKSQVDVSIDSVMTKTLDLNSAPKFDVNASISQFGITIVDTIQLNFKKIAFKAGMSSKPDVDVQFQAVPIRLVGSLSFVNSLQSVIKSDQFSSGPFINITGTGIEAGYNFPVPNLEVGIFALSNMMLGTKLTLPLNRDPLLLGFNFCTRENPFRLMVSCFGGGGFFAIQTSMNGLTRLDAAFEFGAGISLNVGVASGSVSVMGGIYYGMSLSESGAIAYKLSAYLRLTGRLSIIGLIKVTLEFYLELSYESGAEKGEVDGVMLYQGSRLVGTATLTVKVEVLFFSKKVKISVSRTLAGNDADPTFEQSYNQDHWLEYCNSFAS
jgi:hypothetical protein